MMLRTLLCMAFLLSGTVRGQNAAKERFYPIVFDDWWNVDYVKNGCTLAAQNGVKPCPATTTAKDVVYEFENELEVAFATEKACHDLVLTHLTPEMAETAVKHPADPATGTMAKLAKEQWWSLILDLDGHSSNHLGDGWTLVSPSRKPFKGRITTPERVVQQLCKIVKGVGGKTE